MKLVHSLVLSIALFSSGVRSHAGESCGSKEGILNQLTSAFVVPDYFPPESEALKGLASKADYERCSKIAFAPFGLACQQHDECYDARLPKDQCDSALQDAWVKHCRATLLQTDIRFTDL